MNETKKNIVVNILLQGVTAVTGFLLPPLLITHYSSSLNGLVSSIKQFIVYLSLVEAGIGVSSIASMYKYTSTNDVSSRNRVLSATRNFYNISGIIFSILLILCAVIYSVLLGNEVSIKLSFILFLIIGLSTLTDFFLIGKYRVLLFAYKKNYIISLAQILGLLVNTSVSVVLILNNINIVIVQLVASLSYMIRFLFIKVYIRRNFKDLDFNVPPMKSALNQRWDAVFLQLSSLVIYNSPVLILTLFCDLKDVSVYAIYAMLFTAIDNLISVLSNGLSANFGNLYYKDKSALKNYYSKYETISYIFIGIVYSCTFLLSKSFISIYTQKFSDANYIRFEFIPLFIFIGIMNKLRVPGGMLIEAAGKFKETKYRGMIEASINVIASIIFTRLFGMIGVLYGACCSYLYRFIDVIYYSNKHILQRNCLISVVKILLITFIYGIMTFFLKKIHFFQDIKFITKWIVSALFYFSFLTIPLLYIILRRKKYAKD